jgi:hypothetical protein
VKERQIVEIVCFEFESLDFGTLNWRHFEKRRHFEKEKC